MTDGGEPYSKEQMRERIEEINADLERAVKDPNYLQPLVAYQLISERQALVTALENYEEYLKEIKAIGC